MPAATLRAVSAESSVSTSASAKAKAVPGAKLVMYPDMGHDLPPQLWDDVIPEIITNLRRAPIADQAVAAAD